MGNEEKGSSINTERKLQLGVMACLRVLYLSDYTRASESF